MALPGLLDIAPPEIITKRFEIRGGWIEVRGLKNRERIQISRRFPAFGQTDISLIAKSFSENDSVMDDLIVAVIAAGAGVIGDLETEQLLRERFDENERMSLYLAVMDMSSPSPLVESPERVGTFSNGAHLKKNSRKQSSPPLKSQELDLRLPGI